MDIKIPKPPNIRFPKVIRFVQFRFVLVPPEKYYNMLSLWITLYFDAAYDGEASEEPHGASELVLHLDLLVSLDVVEGRRVKVNLNQLQGGLWQLLS